MTAIKRLAFAALVLYAAALPALGSVRKPIERSSIARGNVTTVISMADGSVVTEDFGVGTHMGEFWNHYSSAEGAGTLTAANGDKLFWTSAGGSLEEGYLVIVAGGTGRFEGATGSIFFVPVDPQIRVNMEEGTITITYTYTSIGTLTY